MKTDLGGRRPSWRRQTRKSTRIMTNGSRWSLARGAVEAAAAVSGVDSLVSYILGSEARSTEGMRCAGWPGQRSMEDCGQNGSYLCLDCES